MSENHQTVDVLERLRAGIRQFQAGAYAENAALYQQAVQRPQTPHTLMISCSDSRIDLEKLVNAQPGEIFITRNIGNIVPVFGDPQEGVGAVIEYAVNALKVRHVVVCGHSDCGAMKALGQPESLQTLPAVRSWLQHAVAAEPHAAAVVTKNDSGHDRLRRRIERNVLLQLEHLRTHPAVAEATASGRLTVSGWVYDIGSGAVTIATNGAVAFEAV